MKGAKNMCERGMLRRTILYGLSLVVVMGCFGLEWWVLGAGSVDSRAQAAIPNALLIAGIGLLAVFGTVVLLPGPRWVALRLMLGLMYITLLTSPILRVVLAEQPVALVFLLGGMVTATLIATIWFMRSLIASLRQAPLSTTHPN
jgi:hypothetical protein